MMDPISAFLLTSIADAIIGELVSKAAATGSTKLRTKLRGDPARQALELALGAAIHRYATTRTRLDVARPLLQKKGFLTESDVAAELAQVVRFDRQPDTELIGRRWKAALEAPPSWCNLTDEARLLLEYLELELRGTAVFRPVLDAKRLDAIADQAAISAESLAAIQTQLAGLKDLIAAGLGDLIRTFNRAGTRSQLRDYTGYIEEKTRGFVGRRFVFDAIRGFVSSPNRSCGYFFVRGDPGIGKTALAAQLVKTHGYVHHFNIAGAGISQADAFLESVCAQLIAVFGLDHAVLPPEATRDGGFLTRLLEEVSGRLAAEQKAVIVVDALDEVDLSGLPSGTNALCLPVWLPAGVYFVVTTRPGHLRLRLDCDQQALDIVQDSAGNTADIREYVQHAASRPRIKAYIAAQEIDDELFVEHLVEKSQGNFMYLHYVVPEIERGAYTDLALVAIPAGLENYYEDHWRRMRGRDEEAWFAYKLPVIAALTEVKEPVSLELIAEFSRVRERARIRAVLEEWRQFLFETKVPYDGRLQVRYRMYHGSFHDFLAAKEQVKDERVDLDQVRRQINDYLFTGMFNDA